MPAPTVAPEFLQGLRVIGCERAVEMPGEHDVAGGREHAAIGLVWELGRGLSLAGRRVDRLEAAVAAFRALGSATAESVTRPDGAALFDKALLLELCIERPACRNERLARDLIGRIAIVQLPPRIVERPELEGDATQRFRRRVAIGLALRHARPELAGVGHGFGDELQTPAFKDVLPIRELPHFFC